MRASDERRNGRERRGNQEPDHDDNSQQPAPNVLPEQQTTTKAGKPRQRIAWTTKMNEDIMHCYYTATKLDTLKTGYRTDFHRLFIQLYPQYEHKITAQRVSDQKRAIMTNKLLTDVNIENIKQEVANKIASIHNNNIEQNITQNPNNNNQINDLIDQNNNEEQSPNRNTNRAEITNNPNNDMIAKTLNEINTNLIKWEGVNPVSRPRIPKLIFKKDSIKYIETINNTILPTMLNYNSTIENIHTYIYVAAITTTILNNQHPITQNNKIFNSGKHKWQIRIENKVNEFRRNLGRLTQYKNGNRSKNIIKHINVLQQKNNKPLDEIIDTHKQKLKVYAARLTRYKESNQRRTDNKLFTNNQKTFYKKLASKEDLQIIPPTKEQITNYWKNIWSIPTQHNESATWIRQEEHRQKDLQPQHNIALSTEELTNIINKTHNWKCPGIDNVQNFWYKKFTSTHHHLALAINKIIDQPQTLPEFLTIGKTYIKPKNNETTNPSNYRPITCLPTLYKIITSTISSKIETHLTQQNVITDEQKGCKKNSQGCKEQLIIDTTIMKQATSKQRNLHSCYIDYQKAFDSVPHSWLIKVLQIYKIHPKLINFLQNTMNKWKTQINLITSSETIRTEQIDIKKGIFQGDSLSALWFCLCLNPLSNTLNNTRYGYNIIHEKTTKHTINHLLYMDDIKLYASTQTHLKALLKITEQITNDIKMSFGISKCKAQHIEKGKWTDTLTETLNDQILENMEEHETYKYLGFQQSTKIDHTSIKNHLSLQYKKRLNQILKTQLNSKNLCKAINTYAIPILTYSFGIINWTKTDIDNLERTTRRQLTKHRKLHPNSCTQRLTIPRLQGGRGFIDIQNLHNSQISTLRQFFHTHTSDLHKAIVLADKHYTPLNLQNTEITITQTTVDEKKTIWAQKQLHGKHLHLMEDPNIDKMNSYTWLQRGELHPETEGFIIAVQDQVILTKNYQKYIIKDPSITNDKCRRCQIHPETIDHITAGCQILAGTEYTLRHNIVAKIIHQEIANNQHLQENKDPYYKYIPSNILDNEEHTLYWDTTIHTDKTVISNRPDITLINKINKITYFIEISTPNDTNIHRKYVEKIEKYSELTQEIKRIWKQKNVKTIPFVISATGILHKTFIKNLKELNINPIIHHKIQKAVILKTCNIIRKTLT